MTSSQWTAIPLPSISGSLNSFGALQIVDDPDDPQHLFIATTQGLLVSIDGGQTWTFEGPNVFTVNAIPQPGNPQIVYDIEVPPFGIDAGLYRSVDGGISFSPANTGLPPFSNSQQYSTIAIDPNKPNILYVPVTYTDTHAPAQLWRSTDSGVTWTQLPQSSGSYDMLSVTVDPSNSSHVLLGTADLGLLNSYDGGITWTHASSLLANVIYETVYDKGMLFAATNGGGYRSADDGATWTLIRGSGPNQIGSIVIDPQDSSIIFANSTTSDDVFISIDSGGTWQSLGQVPGGARSLAYDPQNNTLFALGSDLASLYALSLNYSDRPPGIDAAHSIFSGTVNERPNATASLVLDIATGVIAFTDQDLSDRPTASVVRQSVTYSDAQGHPFQLSNDQVFNFENALLFVPESGNTNNGRIDWGLTIVDGALDFLGAGEIITVTKTIEIDNGHGGTVDQDVTVTINGADDLPIAQPDFNTVSKGGIASGNILANDSDQDLHDHETLHVTSVNGASIGAGMSIQGSYGVLSIGADGSYTYSQTIKFPANLSPAEVFSYSIDDGHGGTSQSTLSFAIQTADSHQIALPFAGAYQITQGPDDKQFGGDHYGYAKWAYDFNLPVGTGVLSVGHGWVRDLRESVPDGGLSSSIVDKKGNLFPDPNDPSNGTGNDGNYITIQLDDGSWVSYLHLGHDQVTVGLNDEVFAGTLLGYTGLTGWRTGPHLHIQFGTASHTDSAVTDTANNIKGLFANGINDPTAPEFFTAVTVNLDHLTGYNAGSGAETFSLSAIGGSGHTITSFQDGIDRIDLSAIDANSALSGNQAFSFAGQNSNAVPDAVSWFEKSGNTIVQADVNGDAVADVAITLTGINHHLSASVFVL